MGPPQNPPNLLLKPGESGLAQIEFYLTVPDGHLDFEIYESSSNYVSFTLELTFIIKLFW